MGQYVKKAIPVTAFQWVEGEPWVEGMISLNDISVVVTKNGPVPVNSGDWIMQGDGEYYPCPDEVFQKNYVPVSSRGMNFGQAIDALKAGKRVARAGWNGKGMWIVMMPELQLPPHSSQAPGAKVNDRTAKHIGADTPLDSRPYIAMWTAAQQWQPGWLASQPDILSEDWEIVE